jgi:hypothetical protein
MPLLSKTIGTCSLITDPPVNDGSEIPIKERTLDDPSADGRNDSWALYSFLERTKACTMARVRTTTKLIAIMRRRFHRNIRNLSKHFSFFVIAKTMLGNAIFFFEGFGAAQYD